MHDASHGSIATVNSGHKYLNDVIGMMCSWAFPLPYYPFKYMVGYISVLFNPRSSHLTSSDQISWVWLTRRSISLYYQLLLSILTNSTCNIISGRMFQARYVKSHSHRSQGASCLTVTHLPSTLHLTPAGPRHVHSGGPLVPPAAQVDDDRIPVLQTIPPPRYQRSPRVHRQ